MHEHQDTGKVDRLNKGCRNISSLFECGVRKNRLTIDRLYLPPGSGGVSVEGLPSPPSCLATVRWSMVWLRRCWRRPTPIWYVSRQGWVRLSGGSVAGVDFSCLFAEEAKDIDIASEWDDGRGKIKRENKCLKDWEMGHIFVQIFFKNTLQLLEERQSSFWYCKWFGLLFSSILTALFISGLTLRENSSIS